MKRFDVGCGVLCCRFDMRRAGYISGSTGVDGVLGVKSCIKHKRAGKSLKSEQYDQLVWNAKRMLVDHRPLGGTSSQ
jgi:hypothetical protein